MSPVTGHKGVRRSGARLGALLWLGLLVPGMVQAQGAAAGRAVRENPIAGFRITIPEDWDMATGLLGNTDIAIDAPTGASLAAEPALTFFYATHPPEPEVRNLAELLRVACGAAAAVRPTGRGDEWEMRATLHFGILGPVETRWLCRSQDGVPYVIGALVRSEFAAQYQQDIETALTTCALVPRPTLWRFTEPTERAYYLALPEGWLWAEGKIVRGPQQPGFFSYSVARADGLAGGFVSPPGGTLVRRFIPASVQAQDYVLNHLRAKIPDLQLVRIEHCTRASLYFTSLARAGARLQGLQLNPRVDRVYAEYAGTQQGVRLRVRACVLATLLDESPLLAHPASPGAAEQVLVSGFWAPADQFDAAYPIARGILASLQMDAEWKRRTQQAVMDVLTNMGKTVLKGHEKWDEYIRYGSPEGRDGQGHRYPIPGGPGIPYLDGQGVPKLAPPGQDPPPGAPRLTPSPTGG